MVCGDVSTTQFPAMTVHTSLLPDNTLQTIAMTSLSDFDETGWNEPETTITINLFTASSEEQWSFVVETEDGEILHHGHGSVGGNQADGFGPYLRAIKQGLELIDREYERADVTCYCPHDSAREVMTKSSYDTDQYSTDWNSIREAFGRHDVSVREVLGENPATEYIV